jgi:hypothetical protein
VDPEAESFVTEIPSEQTAGRRKGNRASNLFALAAIVFAVIAVVLYLRDSQGGGIAPVPTAVAGGNQIVNVTGALKAQGLDVQQPPGRFIPVGAFDVPGQGIEINGQPGFIFLFPDAAAAQQATETADPAGIVPDQLGGTPIPPGERRLVQHSNVILLLADGDEETWQKVVAAIDGLP